MASYIKTTSEKKNHWEKNSSGRSVANWRWLLQTEIEIKKKKLLYLGEMESPHYLF